MHNLRGVKSERECERERERERKRGEEARKEWPEKCWIDEVMVGLVLLPFTNG